MPQLSLINNKRKTVHPAIRTAQYWTRMNRSQAQRPLRLTQSLSFSLSLSHSVHLITFSPHFQMSVSHDLSRHFLCLSAWHYFPSCKPFLCLSGLRSFMKNDFVVFPHCLHFAILLLLHRRPNSGGHGFPQLSLTFISDLFWGFLNRKDHSMQFFTNTTVCFQALMLIGKWQERKLVRQTWRIIEGFLVKDLIYMMWMTNSLPQWGWSGCEKGLNIWQVVELMLHLQIPNAQSGLLTKTPSTCLSFSILKKAKYTSYSKKVLVSGRVVSWVCLLYV